MGLFGGMSEEELRTSGTPTSARVVYVDDTGKRREDGAQAKVKVRLKIDSGSARGRDLEQAKWVPVARIPRVGDHVQIRFDPEDVDDWAWGDAAMYEAPRAPLPAATPPPAPSASPGAAANPYEQFFQGPTSPFAQMPGLQAMVEQAFAQGQVTFEQSSHVVDVSGDPQLREQILGAMKAHGIDVETTQQGGPMPQPIGGLPQAAAGAAPGGAPAPGGETTERLRQVDALLEQGLISADEHRDLRRKIIELI